MSKRLSQKEIKHDIREDEVRTFLQRILDSIVLNPRPLLIALGVLVALGLAWGAFGAYLDRQTRAANLALGQTMRIFSAPTDAEDADPDHPRTPSFSDEQQMLEAASDALQQVDSGPAEEIGDLYRADVAVREGRIDDARELWQGVAARHSDDVMGVTARLNLIQLDRQQGNHQELISKLEDDLVSGGEGLPEDFVLFELARTYDAVDDSDRAAELYQRLLDEHPRSSLAGEARRLRPSS